MLRCSLPVPWNLEDGSCSARGCQSIHAMLLGSYILHSTAYYYCYEHYSEQLILLLLLLRYETPCYTREAIDRQQATGNRQHATSQGITEDFDTLYQQAVRHQRDEFSLAKPSSISSRTDPCSFRLN